MADVKAVKSGNWSDPTLWNTGSLPGVSDNVFANNFQITINQNVQVASLSNLVNVSISAVAGGTFNLSQSGLTVQAPVIVSGVVNVMLVSTTGIATVIGNLQGGTTANGYCLYCTASGVFNFTGNCTGGSVIGAYGIYHGSSGTINHTGNTYGGTGCAGIFINIAGVYNLVGNAFGSPTSSQPGVQINTNGTVNHTGNVYAGQNSVATYNNTVGSYILNGSAICHSSGFMPCYGPIKFNTTVSPTIQVIKTNNTSLILQDIANTANVLPAASNVRNGISYNLGAATGTLKVPSPNLVSKGVETDNTVGTAILTAADFLNEIQNSSHELAIRLRNVSTVQTTLQQLENTING